MAITLQWQLQRVSDARRMTAKRVSIKSNLAPASDLQTQSSPGRTGSQRTASNATLRL